MKVRKRLSRVSRATMVIFVAVCLSAALTAGVGSAAESTKSTVTPPPGALKPVPATGMGTPAAMDDPRCNVGAAFSVYGNWNTGTIGTGPACVAPLSKGKKNGGATAPGVTADSVKVVAVIPSAGRSAEQTKAAPPILRAGNAPSTWQNAVHDYLYAYHNFYEQWGRAIDVEFYTSTGIDETAQRADLVAIQAMKPFAVINFDTYGLDVLVTGLAQKKILVQSYSTSPAESAALAPYRWGGGSDQDAAATNAAEVIGKNLVGKNAEFGGADVKSQPRKFGMVEVKDLIDLDAFKKNLAKYKGTKLVSEFSVRGHGRRGRRPREGAAGSADICAAHEGRRRHDRHPVRRPGHERRADGAGVPTGMVPRMVLHRLGLRRPARARPGDTRRAGRARLRHLADRPVLRVPARSPAVLPGSTVRTTGTGARASAPPRASCRRVSPGSWPACTMQARTST